MLHACVRRKFRSLRKTENKPHPKMDNYRAMRRVRSNSMVFHIYGMKSFRCPSNWGISNWKLRVHRNVSRCACLSFEVLTEIFSFISVPEGMIPRQNGIYCPYSLFHSRSFLVFESQTDLCHKLKNKQNFLKAKATIFIFKGLINWNFVIMYLFGYGNEHSATPLSMLL